MVDKLLRRFQELLAQQRGQVLLDMMILLDSIRTEGNVREFAMNPPIVVVR